jgi:DNA-binding IclR family transcriptional regulator
MPASVHKAALVLDLFSVERPDWGPTEVADVLGIAKSTAHALLGELAGVGLTERLPCGRYRLGWRTLELARTKLATSGYRDAIMPTARELASHFGETVHITAWDRGRVLYVASERPPGGVAPPAEPVAAQLTPPGTVLLAERADDIGSVLEPGGLEPGALEPGELERTRRRGYAVGPQRALAGVDCAAAAVRTSDGPATAALALCAPRERFQARRDVYTRAIAGAGERIARSVRR